MIEWFFIISALVMSLVSIFISGKAFIQSIIDKTRKEQKNTICIKPNMRIAHHLDLLKLCGFYVVSLEGERSGRDNIRYFKLSMMAQDINFHIFSRQQWRFIERLMPIDIPDLITTHNGFTQDEIDVLNRILPLASVLFEKIELTTEDFYPEYKSSNKKDI